MVYVWARFPSKVLRLSPGFSIQHCQDSQGYIVHVPKVPKPSFLHSSQGFQPNALGFPNLGSLHFKTFTLEPCGNLYRVTLATLKIFYLGTVWEPLQWELWNIETSTWQPFLANLAGTSSMENLGNLHLGTFTCDLGNLCLGNFWAL